jgi:hypothetical protein
MSKESKMRRRRKARILGSPKMTRRRIARILGYQLRAGHLDVSMLAESLTVGVPIVGDGRVDVSILTERLTVGARLC